MARAELVLGVDGILLMAPNHPVFLAALQQAGIELSWNAQYQCWWAPAFDYFALRALVARFFELTGDYDDAYVIAAIDPFHRYAGLPVLVPYLKSGAAKLLRRGGALYVTFPQQGTESQPLR